MLCQIQILVCQPWSKLGLLLPILGDGNGNTQSIFIRIRIPIERNPIHDGGMTIALKYRALTMAHVNLRNMRVCLRHVLLHNFLPSVDWRDQHWSTMKPRNLLVVALRVLGGWLQHTCHAKVRATWHRLNWGLARLVGLLPKRRWFVMLSQNQWGVLNIDGLYWKILSKWMILGYHHFWKPPIDCSTNWRGKGDP